MEEKYEKEENLEYENEIEEEKINPIKRIKSFLIIIYFIASFICCTIPGIGLISFGQLFLLFGIIAVYNIEGKIKIVGLPFILVGLSCIIIPILNKINSENIIITSFDTWFPIVGLIVMLIAGIVQLTIGLNAKKGKERNCTFKVLATISKYEEYLDPEDRKIMYTPIYSFTYDKKQYEVSQASYSSVEKFPIGNSIEILIDPSNPNDFIMKGFASYKLLIIMGYGFIIPSIIALVYVIYKMIV